jgi:predicted kinase
VAPRRPHLEVLVGIPGSGKTTYADRLRARCPQLCVVSPDAVREQLYPGYAQGLVEHRLINHRRVFGMAYRAIAAALAAEHPVLFDATSLTAGSRHGLIALARRACAAISARYFPISLPEAFRRNRARPRQVPTVVIAHMASILVPPSKIEGFDRVVICRTEGHSPAKEGPPSVSGQAPGG